MKKVFTVLLMGLLLVNFGGSVFAEEGQLINPEDQRAQKMEQRMERRQIKLDIMKEFVDEIHTTNALKMERNTLRNQVIGKHDILIDLYIAAREADNQDALQEANASREQIKELNNEIGDIQKQINDARNAFRDEVQNGNIAVAQGHINSVIDLLTLQNGKIVGKIELLAHIIEILS
ncbi:MAG: hypothetical protein VR72_21800 [Clostridiaceae bacterium BRH_c20a]|nr:MAG: hypothetical protein VR72_21800 [Clostridiaceae bacterium BRH_c20a]